MELLGHQDELNDFIKKEIVGQVFDSSALWKPIVVDYAKIMSISPRLANSLINSPERLLKLFADGVGHAGDEIRKKSDDIKINFINFPNVHGLTVPEFSANFVGKVISVIGKVSEMKNIDLKKTHILMECFDCKREMPVHRKLLNDSSRIICECGSRKLCKKEGSPVSQRIIKLSCKGPVDVHLNSRLISYITADEIYENAIINVVGKLRVRTARTERKVKGSQEFFIEADEISFVSKPLDDIQL